MSACRRGAGIRQCVTFHGVLLFSQKYEGSALVFSYNESKRDNGTEEKHVRSPRRRLSPCRIRSRQGLFLMTTGAVTHFEPLYGTYGYRKDSECRDYVCRNRTLDSNQRDVFSENAKKLLVAHRVSLTAQGRSTLEVRPHLQCAYSKALAAQLLSVGTQARRDPETHPNDGSQTSLKLPGKGPARRCQRGSLCSIHDLSATGHDVRTRPGFPLHARHPAE